jgi:serralysin
MGLEQLKAMSPADLERFREAQVTVQSVILKDGVWDHSPVTVSFLSGDRIVKERITKVAKQWEAVANIHFQFVEDKRPNADIRIEIASDGDSWSKIGMAETRLVLPGQPTMWFGWLNAGTPESDYQAIVLHEFGHALGAAHEHQSPGGEIHWNKPYVYMDLKRRVNWDPPEVDKQVFNRYRPENAAFTILDRSSIMVYAFPAEWTTDNVSMPLNKSISALDRSLMARLYPR